MRTRDVLDREDEVTGAHARPMTPEELDADLVPTSYRGAHRKEAHQ